MYTRWEDIIAPNPTSKGRPIQLRAVVRLIGLGTAYIKEVSFERGSIHGVLPRNTLCPKSE
jgi:hypothetical protein